MKKFMVLYHAPTTVMAATTTQTPEEQAKGMEAWMTWAKECGDKIVDLGSPLINGQNLTPTGTIASSNRDVTGYSIIQAENLEKVEAMLKNHPHLKWDANATIEVHETMAVPGM